MLSCIYQANHFIVGNNPLEVRVKLNYSFYKLTWLCYFSTEEKSNCYKVLAVVACFMKPLH